MSKEVVETIYGKHHKYEVIRESSAIGSTLYRVHCSDGSYSGSFSSLSAAVGWANDKAEKR